MGKLRVFSGRSLIALLQRNGFNIVRQRGSHVVLRGIVEGQSRTVPVPLHDDIKRGELKSVIELSGLPRVLFEE